MVELQLTDNQAKIVSRACEFYARIVLGQFREIIVELINSGDIDSMSTHRAELEELLFEARDLIYPELPGHDASYDIGAFEHVDTAYDVHQAIRTLFGDPRSCFSYREIPKAKHYVSENESNLDSCN